MADRSIPEIPEGRYIYEVIVDGRVRYVGKGSGRRFKNHISTAKRYERYLREGRNITVAPFYEKLLIEIGRGAEICYRIVAKFSGDVDALAGEMAHIASFPKDQLWNDGPGGRGGSSKAAFRRWANESDRSAHKKRLSDVWSDPTLRGKHSQICRLRMVGKHQSNAADARWNRPGEREKMSVLVKKIRAHREAKKKANLYAAFLSFGA